MAEELRRIERFCSDCTHEWLEEVGREKLRRIIKGENLRDCPECEKRHYFVDTMLTEKVNSENKNDQNA